MISELDIGIAISIFGLALIAFWKRALHLFEYTSSLIGKHWEQLRSKFNKMDMDRQGHLLSGRYGREEIVKAEAEVVSEEGR